MPDAFLEARHFTVLVWFSWTTTLLSLLQVPSLAVSSAAVFRVCVCWGLAVAVDQF